MSPGKHVLSLRAADHEDVERALEVQAGTRQDLDVALVAKLAATSVTVPGMARGPVESEISVSTSAPSKPKSRTLTVVTWSSLGGAVAAGAVAGTFWLISRNQYQDFQTARQTYNDSHTQANHDSAANAANKVKQSGWIAIGCGIGAGALAVTALVTYLLNPSAAESKTTVSLSPFGVGVSF